MTAKIAALLAATATGLAAFILSALIITRMEATHLKELGNARDAERAACTENAKLTEEVSRGYQKDLAKLRNDYDATRRMFRATPCVPVAPIAGGRAGSDGNGKLSRPHGIDTGTLLDYARDCERERLTVMACQGFVRSAWERVRQ